MSMLEGKRALVTGGGTGVGAAIALALATAGAEVMICGRRPEPLQELADRHERLRPATCDVTHEEAVERLYDTNGPFDITVANAGSAESAPCSQETAARS